MIAIALAVVAAASLGTVGAESPAPGGPPDYRHDGNSALPAGWHADFGAPVAWHDTTLWFYADAFDRIGPDMQPAPDSQIARSALSVDGVFIRDLLPRTAEGHNYWITDAVELADGTLLVLALEEVDRFDLPPPFNFELVDTDAFIVRHPDDAASWRWATKIDDGPWADDAVYFSDQFGLLFTREPYGKVTEAWRFNPADPYSWQPLGTDLPEGDGVFVPVQTASGWWGVTWTVWHTVEFWRADTLDGVWSREWTESTVLETHDHQLNVVDGRVLWRSNNLDGSRRPEYVDVTERLT